jgi:2-phosphoglycerate kinase
MLAVALSKQKSIPYFSVDHLGSLIRPYIPVDERDRVFPLAAARAQAGGSNDAFHGNHSPADILGLYLRQAEAYWPGLESFVRYGLGDEHDLILEGWQLLPRLVATVVTPENQGTLAALFLYKTDAGKIATGLRAGTSDWVMRHTTQESTFSAIADMIAAFGSHVQDEAKAHRLDAVNTDDDFQGTLSAALARLIG